MMYRIIFWTMIFLMHQLDINCSTEVPLQTEFTNLFNGSHQSDENDSIYENDELYKDNISQHLSQLLNPTKEFVLVTMPKTGTNLMKPILQKLSGRQVVWTTDVFPSIREVRDLDLRNMYFGISENVPVHWFLTPVHNSVFVQKLNEMKKNGQFLSVHAPFSKKLEKILLSRNCVAFFVVRDPRDFVISLLEHVLYYDNSFLFDDWFFDLTTDEQIYYIITGTSWYTSTEEIVKEFIGWRTSPASCVLRFEKLIGSDGVAKQLQELRKIPKALGVSITDKELLSAFKKSFGTGYTFNKAKVGRWKDYFNESHKQIFKELLGKELIELGYEKDLNW